MSNMVLFLIFFQDLNWKNHAHNIREWVNTEFFIPQKNKSIQ